MIQTVTISSKRQITIPSSMFSNLGFTQGDLLVAQIQDNTIVLQKATHALDALAGSIVVSSKKKSLSVEEAIRLAPARYFSSSTK
jgi:bifunctional DNA-binding transcriptional regulator/antitoxin component of YhaV-PrlF toxin-antitoxin module